MRDIVKRRPIKDGDEPTSKKMRDDWEDAKPDVRRVKIEVDDEIEVRKVSPVMDTYYSDFGNGRFLPPITDRFMLIPRDRVGLIIGKKGATIAHLRASFPSVSIVLDSLSGKEHGLACLLYVRGSSDETLAVREMVSEKIGYFGPFFPCLPIHKYFREITVPKNEIYSIDKSKLERENQIWMIVSDEDDGPTRSIIVHGERENVEMAAMQLETMMRDCPDGVMTWRLRVPHYAVGRVIGQRHTNIIETRKKSGARVELSDAREGEDTFFRYLEVVGTRMQIDTADRMIREFSGQYLDGSFLHTSFDSAYSSYSHITESMDSSLSPPVLPPSLPPRIRGLPRLY